MELNLDDLTYRDEERGARTAFYASDCLKPAWELYQSFIGTPKSNPMKWYEKLKFGAGNGVEAAMLQVLKDSGVVAEDYSQHEQGKVNFKRNEIFGFTAKEKVEQEIEIHGRIDAITKDGIPIEIKSVNNKNAWDIKAYEDGYPRENYVGQLSVYMDFLGVDTGYLFVASVDGLNRFWIECKRQGDIFTCGKTKFDLGKEYKRWSNLYTSNILPKIEPDVFEFRYKYPIEELDWTKVSADKTSKARNNKAVVGDFQVAWSGYKDLWVKAQGETLGYTAEEVIRINELTKGYSTWRKK